MKYVHTQIFRVRGLTILAADGDKELVVDEARGLRAVLTSCPDDLTLEADRGVVLAGMILGGIFGSADQATITEPVTARLLELRESRKKELGAASVLVISVTREVADFELSHQQELDEFVVGFGGPSKSAIREESVEVATSVLAATSLGSDNIVGIKKLGDSVVFFRSDGKPVHAYTFSGGTASAFVSRTASPETLQAIGIQYPKLVGNKSLSRVVQLLASSYESEGDKLRSFLAVWTALEIFVNKTFVNYERQLFRQLRLEGRPAAHGQSLDRIQSVMKDKYKIWDKFAVIACELSPADADTDVAIFKSAKDMRDAMSHGQDVIEAALPVASIQNLLRKYLRLHLG
jgi:hypothetical protein